MMEQQMKPTTEVIIDFKQKQDLQEFANVLETIAQKLKQEGKFTFMQGTEEVVVEPSSMLKAEYKYTKKRDKHSFEIEFEWYEGDKGQQTMQIK